MPFRARSTLRLRSVLVLLVLILGWPWIAESASVDGIVVDPDGHPAPGAHVLLTRANAIVNTATTDRAGRFRFDNLAKDRYRLLVALDGFQANAIDVELKSDTGWTVSVPLRVSVLSESIVVSASSVPQPRSQVPDNVTVISADELRARQVETVADALRLIPGLNVATSGGRGAITSLFSRGGESDFTLVLIDGVRVNDFGGAFDFAHLSVVDIDHIEVVRGPQSALWGSNAIGGVVQIVTRRGGLPRTQGLIEGGTFGTSRVSLSTAGSHNRLAWGAGFELLKTDGFTGPASDTDEMVSNDDYSRRNLSFSGEWQNRHTTIQGTVRLGSNERGIPGPFGSDPGGTFAGVDRISRGKSDTHLITVDATRTWTEKFRQQYAASYSAVSSDFVSSFGESLAINRRLQFRTQLDVTLASNLSLSTGIELQRERAESTFITDAAFNMTPVRRLVAGFFGEARADFADRLLISGGLRVEQIRRNALPGVPNLFAPRPDFIEQMEIAVNPKVSFAFFLQPADARLTRWTRLRLSAGTGIRPPGAFEIAFTDNPALKSERSRSVDLGVQQALAGDALLLEATVFFNRYDNLIVAIGRSFQDASQFRTDNIANSRARGLELASVMRLGVLETRVGYTWLDTKVLAVDEAGVAPPPFEVGDPLLRRPRNQGTVDVRVAFDRVAAYVTFGSRGRFLDVDPTFGAFGGLYETPGYGVINIGVSAPAWGSVELFGRIDNLFDRAYEETLGFPALGRRGIGGLRFATR